MSKANELDPPARAKPKAARCRKRRQRRKRQLAYLAICSVSVAVFGFALATLIRPAAAATGGTGTAKDKKSEERNPQLEWRAGFEGHGTTHEQMGELHWAPVDYSEYKSTANFNRTHAAPTTAMNPIFNFTHFLYDHIISDEPALPPGYIVMQGDSLALGPKFQNADFRDLISRYWLVLLWILFLIVIIVVMPFVAVCYCCFCCCRRCRQGCPPCTSKADAARRLWCGICLLILIVGLIFGIVIAFVTNRLLDRGFDSATVTLQRATDDICMFLKDVADHVHHLMVYNYEEMQTHITDELSNAHKHIFLDLADTSESTSLGELERILHNIPQAAKLMKQVAKMETDLRFYGAQLRDGLRGMKRDINFAVANLCTTQECQTFLSSSGIETIDTSVCLHFDAMPNASLYMEGLDLVVKENYVKIPTEALTRLENVSLQVKQQLSYVTPGMIRDLNGGKDTFRQHARRIRNQVDTVLSTIHLKTAHSSRSFDDVYDKFGRDRSTISVIVCLLMIMILFILIVSLMCGCFGRRKTGYRDDCCSRGTAANCLFLAILLIFCLISFITLMGLVYFMVGLVTYQGACAPFRDVDKNGLFRQLDSMIDLNRYLPRAEDPDPAKAVPPLRMSNALKMCEANQSVFDMLRANRLYDINDITRIKVMSITEDDPENIKVFDQDLSKVELLTADDIAKLTAMSLGGAASYHSSQFKDLCSEFTPVNLNALGEKLYALSNSLESPTFGWARVSFWNEGLNAKSYYQNFVPKLTGMIQKMKTNLKIIDELILYQNLDFNNSINTLLEAVNKSQLFIQNDGKNYINTLGKNLTATIEEMITEYIEMVINESNENVGRCEPLAYIYHQGVDLVCRSMVDPINGFWVGILICALLFLPILYVSHRLMCLYKKVYPYMAAVASRVDVVYEGGNESLYDAYSERGREHVPLANVPKKRRKAYERRREQQEYYEDASPSVSRATRSGGGGGDGGGGDGAPGSSSMRYNDMAPTHWDHEPPRYHNPPAAPPSSEYERPPPYYYPGASEQD